jgi:hypothetical protein
MCKGSMYNQILRPNRREVTIANPSSSKRKEMGTPSPYAQITAKVDSKSPKL